ncbi:MAG: phosphoglycerate kinase [Nanoarchaeota archaeon]
MYKYFTIDNFDVKGKIVGVRVDINSPIIDKKVVMNQRIKASALTIKELAKKGAKVIILAHQGRLGTDSCVSLKEHSKLLEKETKIKVNFESQIYSSKVKEKISKLEQGDILLLENLRFYEDEKKIDKPNNIIKELEKLFDFYVSDAFSVVHREQTSMVDNSVVGFKKIPMIAGRQMQKEINGLNRISNTKRPLVYVMGGAKPDDLIEMLKENLPSKKVDFVLLTGVIAEIALILKGYNLGCKENFLKEKKYLTLKDDLKKLLDQYPKNFILPKDLAIFDGKKRIEIEIDLLKEKKDLIDKYLIQDIGEKTINYYTKFLKDTGSIYLKGPAGNFEEKAFERGTQGIIKGIINSNAFTFMGGGHSVTALYKFAKLGDFSYVSLAGGALVKFLSGKSLPGIDSLQRSFLMHNSHFEDFLVVGSNTIDIGVTAPVKFSEFYLGDKIKIDEDFKTNVGGGGINSAIALSRLGSKVAYLGKISQESKDKIYEVLKKDRVEIINTKPTKKPCAKSILLDTKDNDRIIFTYRGQNFDLIENDFKYNDINAKNYYFTAMGGDTFQTLIKLSRKLKEESEYSTTCLSLSSHLIRKEKNLRNLLVNMDIVILNLDEAELLTGKTNITDCLKDIKNIVKEIVVITDGSNGAYAYDGNQEYFIKAQKVTKIVDTTGAGDSFGSTFFYFYVKGYGIQKALKYAVKNSANVIKYKGPQYGLLYYDDLHKKLK